VSAKELIQEARQSVTDNDNDTTTEDEITTDELYGPTLAEWQAEARDEKDDDNVTVNGNGNGTARSSCACSKCGPPPLSSPLFDVAAVGEVPLCGLSLQPPKHVQGALETVRKSVARRRVQQVMRNFRELLWFWREYYLRRGRDRLSIEFSVHMPFAVWQRLVDRLCADDCTEMSLLSSPITMPRSPYFAPTHVYGYQPNEVVNYRL